MLCSECIQYSITAYKADYRGIYGRTAAYRRLTNYEALEQSSCYMCSELLAYYHECLAGAERLEAASTSQTRLGGPRLEIVGTFAVEYSISIGYHDAVTLDILKVKPGSEHQSFYSWSINLSFRWQRLSSLDRNLWFKEKPVRTTVTETIRRWCDECDRKHERVCKNALMSIGSTLPSRLLEIVKPDLNTVRLTDTANMPSQTPFIALSHCWGGKLAAMCTRSNINTFRSGVSLQVLPNIFRETIELASSLDIFYVWIDALCIIQDDADDWSKEAPDMDAVYSNATFVLAAAAAENSVGTLFHKQFPTAQPRFRLRGPHNEMSPEFRIFSLKAHKKQLDFCKLQTRGWVYQERVLASRTVHISKDKIFWECREEFKTDHECLTATGMGPAFGKYFPYTYNEYEAYPIWQALVEQYTQRDLTKMSDRPVAIAGIAKDFQRKAGDQYIAGLWRRHLIHGIVWHVPWGSSPDKVEGPSWSWQTVLSPITYNVMDSRSGDGFLIEILAAGPFQFQVDQFSRCLSGQLTIKGVLLTVEEPIRWDDKSRRFLLQDDVVSWTWYFVPDQHVDGLREGKALSQLRVLPVCANWYVRTIHGLVLESVDRESAHYRRVGYVSIQVRSEWRIDGGPLATMDKKTFILI